MVVFVTHFQNNPRLTLSRGFLFLNFYKYPFFRDRRRMGTFIFSGFWRFGVIVLAGMSKLLEIKNLSSSVESKQILDGVDMVVNEGEAHVIMGPNGSGKSTLALCVMGHPAHKIKNGDIFFAGQKLNNLKTDERARLGIFLGFQNPLAL